jgi:hypothetical protein
MLSYIYGISKDFERENGFPPNLLYMNYAHLECLKQQLAEPNDFGALITFLGMELIITQESVHPSVVWASAPWKQAVSY